MGHEALDAVSIDAAFSQAVDVAFQAVRKPVEGTILTVLRDSAAAAKRARKKKLETDEALAAVVTEAYASVQRTPDLLPVLKENGVVDAGGYGLAIFFDAFTAALTGKEGPLGDELAFARGAAPKVEIEQINDWEGSAYRYCTEFLVHSDTLDVDAAKDFLTTMGDCDLLVGMHPNFKVHVHSNLSLIHISPALLAEFCRAGVPCTVGTDAHTPANVARDIEAGYRLMAQAGYRTVTVPTRDGDRRSITIA